MPTRMMATGLLMHLGGALALSLPSKIPASMGGALLAVRLDSCDRVATAAWLQRRSFAAALPIQPMLVMPLPQPLSGIELTFRRKPSSEKGGQDGGLRFVVSDDESAEADGSSVLLVSRMSEGQYTTKAFSEQRLLRLLLDVLESLPPECGRVMSVADLRAPMDS